MDSRIRLSEDLAFPPDVVTDTIGILAIKGSGKTYTALVLLEQMVAAGIPVVALDPVGVFWGLRAGADGNGCGLPVAILGGSHGDVPLDGGAGRAVADYLVAERQPMVLDFSCFESKEEQRRFSLDFLERLYEINREALHVFIDEADDVAPQRPFGDEARVLRAVEVLVRRGRARGLGCTLITQRAAVLHKNVLTQVSTLILGRTIAPHDRKAIESWIEAHGAPEQKAALLASLATMRADEKWVWSPDRAIFARVAIAPRVTFDSSATPKVGSARIEPKQIAAVDLHRLRACVGRPVEDSTGANVRALRARIAELSDKLAKAERRAEASSEVGRPQATDATELVSSPPTLGRCERAILRAVAERAPRSATRGQLAILIGYSRTSSTFARALGELRRQQLVEGAPDAIAVTRSGASLIGPVEPMPSGDALARYWRSKLPRCESAVLGVLIAAHPTAIPRDEVARRAGYSVRSGAFGQALAKLRSLELVVGLRASDALFDDRDRSVASNRTPAGMSSAEPQEARGV